MDYFQGVVTEYLRSKRSMFVNTECLISLDAGDKQIKGRHWYCDAMAVDLKASKVYLCEITYSTTMHSLIGRLHAWQKNWVELHLAVLRDSGAPQNWSVQPWIFVPAANHPDLNKKLVYPEGFASEAGQMPKPRVTHLEMVLPWKYKNTWDLKVHTFSDDA